MMSSHQLFEVLVAIHITSGSIGLLSFWVPVVGRKGAMTHRRFGKLFIITMLITGTVAVGIALTTLSDPVGTHPHLSTHPIFSDSAIISGIFGWMMLYLAVLTINLSWHGWLVIRHRREPQMNRAWHNLLSQLVLTLVAINCAWQGWLIEQPLMIGISMVGFATVATNLWYLYRIPQTPVNRLREHIKALVGAGISVYTAFFAFGAVRLMPELALTPALWAVPLVVGLTLIFYHRWSVAQQFARSGKAA
ncbi:conserved hypothetical protein [Luminiphilus syltensis NOR5-1B]|uniref:DUF2306 domain-containing protein n=1 Tax=Luminiphilus syltensis NOR5-1B TaxID=565045 RepID=B8KT10_9GAMM|nr:membrane protein [Luminiphilus syltensis]EED35645.1 conserved hypothetical protein [Luminiphilus syltensis NOR5-1B]